MHQVCLPYFLEEEHCGVCNRLSRYLQRSTNAPDSIMACPSCLNSATHATCARCRKYRKVVTYREDGRALCGACGSDDPAEHACPGCGSDVNGAGAGHCDGCVIRLRLQREVDLHAAILERDWVASLYRDFALWSLARAVPTPILPKKVAAAAKFFRVIDQDDTARQPISGCDLLRLFDSKSLRANLNATRFLAERFGFIIDEKARAEGRDVALIARRLQESSTQPWGEYLAAYRCWLEGRPLRTICLYLGVAESFCKSVTLEGSFTQAELVQFLRGTPGARATISVWVTFVRHQYGCQVTMPPAKPAKLRLARDLEQLVDLLPQVDNLTQASDEALARYVCLLFEFDVSRLRRSVTGVDANGNLLTPDGVVEVPREARRTVEEWARRTFQSSHDP